MRCLRHLTVYGAHSGSCVALACTKNRRVPISSAYRTRAVNTILAFMLHKRRPNNNHHHHTFKREQELEEQIIKIVIAVVVIIIIIVIIIIALSIYITITSICRDVGII
jgi:archaellum biogenesis protein FlaJ (TadC family)